MTKKEYNGWFNYETWLANLWMDNDQGSQSYWAECAKECYDQAEPGHYEWQTKEFEAAYTLAQQMKDQHDEQAPTDISGLYTDLLAAAMCEINWQEIAEQLIAVCVVDGES